MRYFDVLGPELESSRKWGLGMAPKTTRHFSFLKAGPDSGSMETAVSWELFGKPREDLQMDCLEISALLLHPRENISALFEQLGVPKEFDLLSLDIDQNTYYAWEGLRGFRSRVVVVEYNAAIPPDVDWKVRYDSNRKWNGTQNFGASLKAFEILGRQFGYSLVGCELLGANAFFVRDDLLAGKFAEPFTSENHYEPPRYSMWHRRCHPPSILDRTDPS